MIEFELKGTNFKFRKEDNQDITNFDWFVGDFSKGEWEKWTFDIFEECANPKGIALDIGAWIGPTSIWLANHFREVYSLEPDPVAFKSLSRNLSVNGCKNALPIDKALYHSKTELGFGLNPEFAHEGLGASTSQIKPDGSGFLVKTTTLRELSRMIPFRDVSFVKVDIEGAEEFIVESLFKYASEYKWDVLMEIHPSFMSEEGLRSFEATLLKYSPQTTESGSHKFFRFR